MASIQLSGLPESTTAADSDYVHVSKSGIDYRMSTENYSKGTFPIGSTLIQFPNKESPSEMGLFGTWENISSEFAGDFFRAEGGNATTFEAGEQLDKFQGHYHNGNLFNGVYANGNTSVSGNSSTANTGSIGYVTAPITDGTNGTPRTGIETNPVNHTIRIWERTA